MIRCRSCVCCYYTVLCHLRFHCSSVCTELELTTMQKCGIHLAGVASAALGPWRKSIFNLLALWFFQRTHCLGTLVLGKSLLERFSIASLRYNLFVTPARKNDASIGLSRPKTLRNGMLNSSCISFICSDWAWIIIPIRDDCFFIASGFDGTQWLIFFSFLYLLTCLSAVVVTADVQCVWWADSLSPASNENTGHSIPVVEFLIIEINGRALMRKQWRCAVDDQDKGWSRRRKHRGSF